MLELNRIVNMLSMNSSYGMLRVGTIVTDALQHLIDTKQIENFPGKEAAAKPAKSAKTSTKTTAGGK